MSLRFWIRFAGAIAALVLGVALVQAWRADHKDRAQLASDLKATQQALAQANARQQERDQQQDKILAQLEERKRTVHAPSQTVQELSQEIPVPVPLMLSPTGTPAAPEARLNRRPGDPEQPSQGIIPEQDLKPLYDFVLDCKACQARLSTAQGDLADERTKTDSLRRERDNALRTAHGGSAWRRVARAAKWLAIGAAAGAVAAKAAH